MKCYGKINKINHIVISDPSYKKDVSCRYEINNLNEKNWLVDIEINEVEDKFDNIVIKGIEFYLLLHKNNDDCIFKNKDFKYKKNIEIKNYEIGMDTACVALGINDKAKEIVESPEEWHPTYSIFTATDGYFGDVFEGKKADKVSFILINGYVCEDTNYKSNDILNYLVDQFEIVDLQIEKSNDSHIEI